MVTFFSDEIDSIRNLIFCSITCLRFSRSSTTVFSLSRSYLATSAFSPAKSTLFTNCDVSVPTVSFISKSGFTFALINMHG